MDAELREWIDDRPDGIDRGRAADQVGFKVVSQLRNDWGPTSALCVPEEVGDAALDREEFALTYGMAWAIARSEWPFASDDEMAVIARRAACAAWEAYRPSIWAGA
jgi:hypothetical protein